MKKENESNPSATILNSRSHRQISMTLPAHIMYRAIILLPSFRKIIPDGGNNRSAVDENLQIQVRAA